MPVTSIKNTALQALAAYLVAQVPSLAGRCAATQADSESKPTFPYVRVLAASGMPFTPFSEETLDESVPNKVLLDVGCFEGPVEIRLGAQSQPEREQLEEKILAAFLQRDQAPGVVVVSLGTVTLPGGTPAYQPFASFTWMDEEWVEEKVFDKKRFSSLTVEMSLPVLVMRDVVGDITTLQIQLELDSGNGTTATTNVAVADDGSITPA